MCFIISIQLIAIIDSGAFHSFISLSCVERLNVDLTPMLRVVVIDTTTNGSVTTSLVSVKYPVNFSNMDIELDLVCFPLVHMDVIFGVYWMLSFGININCLSKSMTFSKRLDRVGDKFLSVEQVKKYFDGEACVFRMFSLLKERVEKGVGDLPVV